MHASGSGRVWKRILQGAEQSINITKEKQKEVEKVTHLSRLKAHRWSCMLRLHYRCVQQHCWPYTAIKAWAQANQEIKAKLERLTAAARAEEAKDASLAADVQQMRLEVAAKQACKHLLWHRPHVSTTASEEAGAEDSMVVAIGYQRRALAQ
jgi:hypothetical protein